MKMVFLDRSTLGQCDLSPIEQLGETISYENTSKEQRLERCKDAEIIFTNKVILDAEILSQLKQLKLICVLATGTNNIDLEYCEKNGIEVKNVAGYSTSAVAQHTLTLAFSLLARLRYYDEYCRNGEWCKSAIFTHINGGLGEIEHLKWGIIGFGAIGQMVAKHAQYFGAQVSYYSTSGKNTNTNFPQNSLETLLSTSDIVSIHAPLNPSTTNLINANNIRLLKSGAILINVGRGGIVNEEDIANALVAQNIYFATDVLESEPMKPNHVFLNPKISHRIIITPHIAWAYGNARERLIKLTKNNVEDFLKQHSR